MSTFHLYGEDRVLSLMESNMPETELYFVGVHRLRITLARVPVGKRAGKVIGYVDDVPGRDMVFLDENQSPVGLLELVNAYQKAINDLK